MTVIRIKRRIRKIQGRQMIRFTLLPFQQQQQQQYSSLKRIRVGGGDGGSSCFFIVVTVGFLLLCVTSRFSVSAEGPHCNQVGHGPEDIIMATGRINPKYTWYKRGHKTYVPVVMDPTYSHKEHSTIVGGFNEISEKTCVKFDFYDDEHSLHGKDYVYITRTTKRGCWSYIGRIGRGKQEIGLPPGCITHRTAMKNGVKIGVRQKMSHWDAKKINIMYGCHAGGGGGGGGGHLSWSPEHDDGDDVDPRLIDDSLSPLLSRNASSSPSSAEIEVAYDELDYDPGRSGSGSSPRARSSSIDDDEHDYHRGEGGGGDSAERFSGHQPNNNDGYSSSHDGHPHSSGFSHNRHGHNSHEEPNNQFDSGSDHHDNTNNNHDGFTHSPNHYPQSYSHFTLDTYPGGGSDVGHDDNNNAGNNDDFYDF